MFSVEVVKINYRNNYQNRFIAITTKNIYNLKGVSAVSRFFSKKKMIIRQKFPISKVNRIVYSNVSDQFVIGNRVYDLVYESTYRNDIIEYLMRAIDIQVKNKSIDYFFVDDFGLTELANHEGRTAEKKTDAESMSLTYNEYVYHFLGKQKKNSEPTDKTEKPRFKVTVDDFEFHRVLGTGGFSKVFLFNLGVSGQT
jgi:Unconventional myosin tail, actin- and lipid-binding